MHWLTRAAYEKLSKYIGTDVIYPKDMDRITKIFNELIGSVTFRLFISPFDNRTVKGIKLNYRVSEEDGTVIKRSVVPQYITGE